MLAAAISVIAGLVLLVWSADRFVAGSAATARHFGVPPLLIGMVIVGFGTSAPEMFVSGMSALQGNPGIALGNAYGSNISNIALILGVTAVLSPIAVHSGVLRRELPVLTGLTLVAAWQLWDGDISRADAVALLAIFALLMGWSIRQGLSGKGDTFGGEMETELLSTSGQPLSKSLVQLGIGLVVLIVSSRLLVWGAVEIARGFGIDDLIIGLTVVAIGTSLPELASSVLATRKGEHDIALGNVLGSNLFNTLAVVGIAGSIEPMAVAPEVLTRDVPVMGALTVALFVLGYGFRGRPGRINRVEGGMLLVAYVAYMGWVMFGALGEMG